MLCAVMIIGLFAGCSGKDIKIERTLSNEQEEFFMDRQYALTASDVDTTEAEMQRASDWLDKNVINCEIPAFDFKMGNTLFSSVIKDWTLKTDITEEDNATQYTLTYTKSDEPLEITVYGTKYKNYAVIEWTVWLENKGNKNSENITDFYALNSTFAKDYANNQMDVVLFEGSRECAHSFKPEMITLENEAKKEIGGSGGKPTVRWATYFNTRWRNEKAAWGKEGIFFSVGWPGQWYASIENKDGLKITAKQERLDTYLAPGEAIRSPLMTMLFWEKDIMRSQNLWRRWVYTEAMPQPDGHPIETMICEGGTGGFLGRNEKQDMADMDTLIKFGLKPDYWWLDAGWYERPNNSQSWSDTGTWIPEYSRWGEDLHEIGDKCKENDMGFIMWYEPERVTTGSKFYNDFKENGWLILDTGWHCFNLANDEAAEYLTNFLCEAFKRDGVTVYRQDANINMPSFQTYWKKLEEDGRKGYSENRYVINYLKMFDGILDALPDNGFIDTCGSGGSRIDLETTKRAVALWRDDKNGVPLISQCQTWGVNFFMPFTGQSIHGGEDADSFNYNARSTMMQSSQMAWGYPSEDDELLPFKLKAYNDFKAYMPYTVKDYYPLSAYNEAEDGDIAWEFLDPETQNGIIQLFKREGNAKTEFTYYLSGLDPNAKYEIYDVDTKEGVELGGKSLMQDGVTFTVTESQAAKIYTIEQK